MMRSRWMALALLAALLVMAGCGKKTETRSESSAPPEATGTETAAEVAAGEVVEQPDSGPVWLAYDAGLAKAKAESKLVLIDFWTGWCHWCKVMDKETYGSASVVERLAKDFVCVKVNAESDKPQGGEGAPSGRALAADYGVSSYPTTWFVDSQGAKIAPLAGYLPPERFVEVLDFISSGAYKTQDFQAYQESRARS